jgi:hypothetical protein
MPTAAEPQTDWSPIEPVTGIASRRHAIGLGMLVMAVVVAWLWAYLLVDLLFATLGHGQHSAYLEWVGHAVRGRDTGWRIAGGHRDFLAFAILLVGNLVGGVVVAMALLVASNKLLVPSYADVRRRDRRPPVLYLRPFGEDDTRTTETFVAGETIVVDELHSYRHLEPLNAIGPVVTVARPSTATRLGFYPDAGPYYVMVRDADWQAEVEALVRLARLVVIVIGASPGIEWELELVRAQVAPERLLLFLPPRDVNAWTRKGREEKRAAQLDASLARVEASLGCRIPRGRTDLRVMGFKTGWNPVLPGDATVRRRWWWTENDLLRAQVSDQFRQVLAVTAPDAALGEYVLRGKRSRTRRWWTFAAAAAIGLAMRWVPAATPVQRPAVEFSLLVPLPAASSQRGALGPIRRSAGFPASRNTGASIGRH